MSSFHAFFVSPAHFFRAARRQWKVAYLNLVLVSIICGIVSSIVLIPKTGFHISEILTSTAIMTACLLAFTFLSTLGILVTMNHYKKTDWFGRISAVSAYSTAIIPFYGIIFNGLQLLQFLLIGSYPQIATVYYIVSIIIFLIGVIHVIYLHATGLSIFYNCTDTTAYKYVTVPLVSLLVLVLIIASIFAL